MQAPAGNYCVLYSHSRHTRDTRYHTPLIQDLDYIVDFDRALITWSADILWISSFLHWDFYVKSRAVGCSSATFSSPCEDALGVV